LPDHTTAPRHDALTQSLASKPLPDHLDEIRMWHQHEAIFFREDNQIFSARKCLLVEGPAEKYSLPVLAAKLGYDLGELTVISCNGKSKIPYYQLLSKAFEVPYFTLFDLDARGEDDGDNQRPGTWAADGAKWTFTASFEKLLGVSGNADHKGSMVLVKVDAMSKGEIPAEINSAIEAIGRWSLGAVAESESLPNKTRKARKEPRG
jgi:predicted ATP-dependent endonuclease of OLD family